MLMKVVVLNETNSICGHSVHFESSVYSGSVLYILRYFVNIVYYVKRVCMCVCIYKDVIVIVESRPTSEQETMKLMLVCGCVH